jgi:predicted enzyme related to lactoylglutathione lyase
LGNARVADLDAGGLMGVRAPMHESERPVVRLYFLVANLEAAIKEAAAAGGELAHPAMELPDLGSFAIFLEGGGHFGLWQV